MRPVPALARWLLARAAARDDRTSVLADMADEAAMIDRRSGPVAAREWYWRQTLRSLGPLVRQRLFPSASIPTGVPVPHPVSRLWVGLATDVRHAARRLRRAPAFAIVAVATLALGLGANTAVFTLVNAVMLAPLPVPAPNELYRLGDNAACCVTSGLMGDFSLFSWPLYEHLRETTPEFSSLAAFQAAPRSMGIRRPGGTTEAVLTEYVSANYFTMFGIDPAAGRLWDDRGSAIDGAVPVVLSYPSWEARFHLRQDAIGAVVTLNNTPAVIVGVMPRGFFGDTLRPDPTELWLPMSFEPLLQGQNSLRDAADQYWLYAMGRLRANAAPAAVSAKTTGALQTWLSANVQLTAADRAQLPRQHIVASSARGGVSLLRYSNEQSLRLLAIAAAAVLLIACANVANLLLVRGLARGPELALRTALGAPRSRLIRESLVDGLLLTCLGGTLSVALASAGAARLLRLAFPTAAQMPVASPTAWPVLLFALGISLAAASLFAVLPAILTSRLRALDAARSTTRIVGDSGGWTRRSLVVVQVALSLALVTSAGLLAKNVYLLETQPFGFDTDGRYVVAFDPTLGGTAPGALPELYARLDDQLMRVPGVRSVSVSLYGPLVGNNWSSGIVIEGHEQDKHPSASWDRVRVHHFETMGTPILRGRAFDERDTPGAERVAVVNETFVRQILGGQDPIGRHFGFANDGTHSRDFVIVGLVGDAKYATPRGHAFPTFFLPFFQDVPYADASALSVQTRSNYAGDLELWVRAPSPTIERDVRAAVARASPSLSVRRFMSMPDQVATNFTRERLVTSLAGLFAGLALLLACVGLYGVTAYGVSRRVREIGVRMALGADRARVMRGVMTGALLTTGAGLVLGLAAALAAGRLLRQQLFGVSTTDATVFIGAGVVLVIATALASAIPARRAAAIDPIAALRAE